LSRSAWVGSKRIRTFEALKHRDYARFWSADLLPSIGHFIREIALYWYAYEITGSAFALGVLSLFEAAPRLILGPFVGVVVDRYDRLKLVIWTQGLGSIPIFGLTLLYFLDALQFWEILALEALYTAIRSINPSASQSLIRDFVPQNTLLSAVSVYSLGFNMARVAGPSLGGILLGWIGAGGCFLIHAVTLLVSVVLMLRVKPPAAVLKGPQNDFLAEFKEGLAYVWRQPFIRSSIGAAWAISVFIGTYPRFLPVFAKKVLEVGPEGLGLLMAGPGIGAVIALTVLSGWGEKWNKEMLAVVLALLAPLLLVFFCVSRTFAASALLLGLVGAAHVGFRTFSRLIIQMEVPRELLGRVMSVLLLDNGLRALGSVVIGASVGFLGAALGLGLTSGIAIGVIGLLFGPLYVGRFK